MTKVARTRAFAKNALAKVIYMVIVIASGFIIPRIILVHYGSEANGLINSLKQFINGFGLVEAGLGSAGVLALYKPFADGDQRAISCTLSAIRRLYLQIGWVFMGLVVTLAVLYPRLKPTGALSPLGVTWLALALGTFALLDFFAVSKHRIFLCAGQREWVITLCSAIAQVLTVCVIALGGKLGLSLWIVYLIGIFPILVRMILIVLYVRRESPWIQFNAPPDYTGLQKRWDVLVLQILETIQGSTPVILITVFLPLTIVSVYSVHVLVVIGLAGLLSIFISGLSASFGDVIVRGEKQTLRKAVREFEVGFYGISSLIYAVAALLISPFVTLFTHGVKDTDYHQPIFAYLIILNALFYALTRPHLVLVNAAGLYRETRRQALIQTGILLLLGVGLTPFFGLIGLSIAMISSNLYRCIVLVYFMPKHLTGFSMRESFGRLGICLMTAALIFIPVSLIGVHPTTPLEWILNAAVITLYGLGVTAAMNLRFQRQVVLSILSRFKKMLCLKS